MSLSNAGGVGAILQIADHPTGKTYVPTYDGNGNIVALLNADTGAVAAAYKYSPFGEPLRAQTSDPTIADNQFRFSTKWTDLETGLVYYGHRYYNPRDGRFINRDPIEESGGLNLYGFCENNAIGHYDYLGEGLDDPVLNVGTTTSWTNTTVGGYGGSGTLGSIGIAFNGSTSAQSSSGGGGAKANTPIESVGTRVVSGGGIDYFVIDSAGNVHKDNARSLAAWNVDPAQVNNPGDWSAAKAALGLTEPTIRNTGTLQGNLKAAVEFLVRKGFVPSGVPVNYRVGATFDGWEIALERYNGRHDTALSGGVE